MYHLLDDEAIKKITTKNKILVKHALYWHHAKPIRKTEFDLEMVYKKLCNNIGDNEFPNLIYTARQVIKGINALANDYMEGDVLQIEGLCKTADEDKIDGLAQMKLPMYKNYSTSDALKDYLSNISSNANHNLARAAMISADRLVSALSKAQLSQHLTDQTLETLLDSKLNTASNLTQQIRSCLSNSQYFADSTRNQQQSLAAEKLATPSENEGYVKVLQGPAGCGKTKIALEWAVKTNAQQILWICPRVLVCQGLLDDLRSQAYLFNSKIEIYTGEFKYQYQAGKKCDTPEDEVFSGDIVITTIDQISNSITTHKQIESFVNYMNAHVVFDEYHEYINMPAFNLLFAELVACKSKQAQQAQALLVSATPNYYFVEQFLGLHRDDIVTVPSFNTSQYQIVFETFDEAKLDESNPFYRLHPTHSFVISNTVLTAQRSFITHQQQEKAILLHSKFKKSDKAQLFEKTLKNFGQHGTQEYELLRSGPIVQAALNISCMHMVTEFTHAENWLQRLGRLDRFSKNTEVNRYIIAIPETLANGKQQGNCARFLNGLHTLQSAKKWYEFLQDKIDQPLTIANIYQLYQDFYRNPTYLAAIGEDFIKALKKSAEVMNAKLIDPVTLPRKPASGKVKIKKSSLRGDNRFVQMAVWNIKNGKEEFPNEYAYPETSEEGELTVPVEDILGYGNSEQNLLAFMVKKHHNIKDTKKAYKDSILLNEARCPDTPVYLSYVPEDLKKVEAQPHSYAIYYAQGIHQPIGAISISKLQGD
jgi:CRISPR-associated endonuclease/helicase Cas3